MGLQIKKFRGRTAGEREVEIVERKGEGHPDYLSDTIAENFSNKLYKKYQKEFGRALHYNVDKLQLVGGSSTNRFGGGRIKKPINVIFSGRAVNKIGEKEINIKSIAKKSAKETLDKLRFLDPKEHVEYSVKTKEGSSVLQESVNNPKCNDTSFGVAYWPLSDLEELVLKIEKHINSKEFKSKFPFTGEDVKVMGTRKKDEVSLTLAIAFVDKLISSYEDYFKKKEKVKLVLEDHVRNLRDNRVKLRINTLDSRNKKQAYLTVTGTSLECGDDGAVGRGNRINGLITPCRPMSLEAVAGKNVVSHTGKLYNVLALEIAKRVHESGGGLCSTKLLSRIGEPLNEPYLASIRYKGSLDKEEVKEIYLRTMDEVPKIRKEIIKGKTELF